MNSNQPIVIETPNYSMPQQCIMTMQLLPSGTPTEFVNMAVNEFSVHELMQTTGPHIMVEKITVAGLRIVAQSFGHHQNWAETILERINTNRTNVENYATQHEMEYISPWDYSMAFHYWRSGKHKRMVMGTGISEQPVETESLRILAQAGQLYRLALGIELPVYNFE